MERTTTLRLRTRISLLYFLLNLISIALFTYIITSNQAVVLTDLTRYQAKDAMSLLTQNLRRIPDFKEPSFQQERRLAAIDSTFQRLAPRYALFTSDSILRSSEPAPQLPADFREAGKKALFMREFSGMDYFLQLDSTQEDMRFYFSLDEFGLPGTHAVAEWNLQEVGTYFRSMFRLIGFTVAALSLLHLAFAFFLFRSVINPISRLSEATRRLSSGNYESSVVPVGDDEISNLGLHFNQMARTIRRTIAELKDKVEIINVANAKLEHMATTDELMQIYNRRYVMSQLESLFNISERYKRLLSVILIDVDHFKRVNDSHGHQSGDLVLREVAARIKSQNRTSDILARYGGEELLLILPETGVEDAMAVAEKIRRFVASSPILLGDSEDKALPITISLGVAEYTLLSRLTPGITMESLLGYADQALYTAKALGRNQTVSAHSAPKIR